MRSFVSTLLARWFPTGLLRPACALASFVALAFTPVFATTVEKMDLPATVKTADVVVRGTFGVREPLLVKTPQMEVWLTAHTFTVDHTYVGSVGSTTIKVCHPGGLEFSDGLALAVPSGFPTHQSGDTAVLMLEEQAGFYVITGLHQGLWNLDAVAPEGAKSAQPTVYAHRGVGTANLVDAKTQQKAMPDLFEKTVMTLGELEGEIAEAAGEAEKSFTPAKAAPVLAPDAAKSSSPTGETFTYLKVNQPLRSTPAAAATSEAKTEGNAE